MGYSTTIQCVILSSLEGITIKWTNKDKENISSNNALVISNVVLELQNTEYACTAVVTTNPKNCSTESSTITINIKGNELLSPPFKFIQFFIIETYISSVTVKPYALIKDINSSVLLNCTITLNTVIGPNTSFITYYWYRDNTNITSGSTPLMISGEGTSLVTTLNISSVAPFNAGVYMCKASIDDANFSLSNTLQFCAQGEY